MCLQHFGAKNFLERDKVILNAVSAFVRDMQSFASCVMRQLAKDLANVYKQLKKTVIR